MKASRRELLGLGAAALAAAGCSRIAYRVTGNPIPEQLVPPKNPGPNVRLAHRIGFGARPGELHAIEKMGHRDWVKLQLAAQQEEPLILQYHLNRIDVLRIDGRELRDFSEDLVLRQLQQAAILRATLSPNALRERMVDFWSNHFNIFARKGLSAFRTAKDQSDVIRKHALGKFPDMVKASAHSPAMLAFLDNIQSRAIGPNENYARELMELHTLGVNGGYTQKDVREVARCFTGWTIEWRMVNWGKYRFRKEWHDPGEKVVLGHRIPAGGGKSDGDRVLDIVTSHPSTARHIASKMCRHFLGVTEGPWVDRLAAIYTETGGDIRAMLEPMLTSEDLQTSAPLVKRPFDYLVASLKATAAETDGELPLQRHLVAMGQPLYQWPMPDGYPDRTAAWTGSLLARWNYAIALCRNEINGTRPALEEVARRAGDRALTATLIGTEEPGVPSGLPVADQAALALSSPAMMWR